MCPRKNPSPSKAAKRLKEYLDIFDVSYAKRGKTLRYDIYRRAGTQWQTDRVIEYLEKNGLIEGDKIEGYYKTEKGEVWHSILKKHNDLVGVLTKELSGDRVKRWQKKVIGIKDYEILYDTGEARKLVAQINGVAREGQKAKSIGGLGNPTGFHAVYVLREHEVG